MKIIVLFIAVLSFNSFSEDDFDIFENDNEYRILRISKDVFYGSLKQFPNYQLLEFSGYINRSHYKLAKKIIERIEERKTIVMNLSGLQGGRLLHFRKIRRKIRKKCPEGECRIDTYLVEKKSACSSACISLFMVGDNRRAYEETMFGFHAVYAEIDIKIPWKKDSEAKTIELFRSGEIMRLQLKRSGVNKEWLWDNRDLYERSDKLTYKKSDELMGSNIVTDIFFEEIDLESLDLE